MIPQAAWSPAAAGTLKFIQRGKLPQSMATPYYNDASLPQTVNDDKAGARIDWDTQSDWPMEFLLPHRQCDCCQSLWRTATCLGFPTTNP